MEQAFQSVVFTKAVYHHHSTWTCKQDAIVFHQPKFLMFVLEMHAYVFLSRFNILFWNGSVKWQKIGHAADAVCGFRHNLNLCIKTNRCFWESTQRHKTRSCETKVYRCFLPPLVLPDRGVPVTHLEYISRWLTWCTWNAAQGAVPLMGNCWNRDWWRTEEVLWLFKENSV